MSSISGIAIAVAVCGYLAWVTFESLADPPPVVGVILAESKGGARCQTPPGRKPRCREMLKPGPDIQVLATPFR